jgi:hypothetical protein
MGRPLPRAAAARRPQRGCALARSQRPARAPHTQKRRQGGDSGPVFEDQAPEQYLSALPFLPPLTDKTLNTYYTFYGLFVAAVISFGALLAPLLEVKIGIGGAGRARGRRGGRVGAGRGPRRGCRRALEAAAAGPPPPPAASRRLCPHLGPHPTQPHPPAPPKGTSYLDFVKSLHLPLQLAAVDPIVASFCGGAVGAVSALLVVEVDNVKKQQKNRCPGGAELGGGQAGACGPAGGGGGTATCGQLQGSPPAPAEPRPPAPRTHPLTPRPRQVPLLRGHGLPAVRPLRRQRHRPRDARALLLLRRHEQGHVHGLPVHRQVDGHGARPAHRPLRGLRNRMAQRARGARAAAARRPRQSGGRGSRRLAGLQRARRHGVIVQTSSSSRSGRRRRRQHSSTPRPPPPRRPQILPLPHPIPGAAPHPLGHVAPKPLPPFCVSCAERLMDALPDAPHPPPRVKQALCPLPDSRYLEPWRMQPRSC